VWIYSRFNGDSWVASTRHVSRWPRSRDEGTCLSPVSATETDGLVASRLLSATETHGLVAAGIAAAPRAPGSAPSSACGRVVVEAIYPQRFFIHASAELSRGLFRARKREHEGAGYVKTRACKSWLRLVANQKHRLFVRQRKKTKNKVFGTLRVCVHACVHALLPPHRLPCSSSCVHA
jgi:hypothetical protein